jgi:hypothetical protein
VFQQTFDQRENPSLGAALNLIWARLTARSSGQFMHGKSQNKGERAAGLQFMQLNNPIQNNK